VTSDEAKPGFDFAPPPPPGGDAPSAHALPTPASAGIGEPRHDNRASVAEPGRSRAFRKRRGGRRGSNGRWVFVTIIAAIALIVGGVAWAAVLTYRTSGVKPADVGATGVLHTGQIVTGMCLKDAPDAAASSGPVKVVRCSDPHHGEALVSYTLTAKAWPGAEVARAEVTSFCAEQVDPDVGYIPPSAAAPDYEWLAWVPTADTWRLGDRTGVCIVTTKTPVAGLYGAGTAHDATDGAVAG
jgi:hypothetical protein